MILRFDDERWKGCVRPCHVHGRRALWHRWIEVSQIVNEFQAKVGGHPGGLIRDVFALVEFPDGTVEKVDADDVKFVGSDRAFTGWYFEDED